MRSPSRAPLIALTVFAALASPRSARAELPSFLELSAGAKLLAGVDVWMAPSNVPGSYDGLGFPTTGAGVGFGGGAYVEARFHRFIGLEIDGVYVAGSFHRNVTVGGALKTTEEIATSTFHVPILVKAVLPGEKGRFEVFGGPELVVPLSVTPSLEVTSNNGSLQTTIGAEHPSSVLLTFGLGGAFKLPGGLELPIELRASKNLSQPDAWGDRVRLDLSGNALVGYTVQAQSSWDFRLGVGLGYAF